MGSIIFGPKGLPDNLTELAGSKAGLAMSIEEICDSLSEAGYADMVLDAEANGIRIRSEEYEDLFYSFMHSIGHTEDEYQGPIVELGKQYHRYKSKPKELELFMNVTSEMTRHMREALGRGEPPNPEFVLTQIKRKYGTPGALIALETFEINQRGARLSPYGYHFCEWQSPIELKGLFSGSKKIPERGRFIDQRYIDYLSNNSNRLGTIHWRKFEQLTAEFYEREGYLVNLGPGSNDNGVDVRIWHPDSNPAESPLCIVQCKRVHDKVDKVTVKGLHADVEFEQASYGVIVTTSELSPGAKTTISARGYSIQAVERDGVKSWLNKLRTPGTGIVR